MAFNHGSNELVNTGLVFCIDGEDPTSYVSGSTQLNDIGGGATGTLDGVNFVSDRFSYDGTNDTINMGNTLHFSDIDPWTVCFWVYLDNTDNWQNFIGDRLSSGNYNGWNIYVSDNSDRCQVYIKNAGGDEIRAHAGAGMPATTWIHKCVTYDGSTDASGVGFYHNGAADTSTAVADNLSNWSGNTGNLYIGTRGGDADYFGGDHGPIVAYNRVLSASEILQNFNAHRHRFGL